MRILCHLLMELLGLLLDLQYKLLVFQQLQGLFQHFSFSSSRREARCAASCLVQPQLLASSANSSAELPKAEMKFEGDAHGASESHALEQAN